MVNPILIVFFGFESTAVDITICIDKMNQYGPHKYSIYIRPVTSHDACLNTNAMHATTHHSYFGRATVYGRIKLSCVLYAV